MAFAIAALLRQQEIEVTEPTLDFEHGWEFFVCARGRRFWVLVTDLERTKLIQTQDASSIFTRLFTGGGAYTDFLNKLEKVLLEDARFSHIKWS